MPSLAEQSADRASLVAALASEAHLPVADVAALYEAQHAALSKGARITTFLTIFTVRGVREDLKRRRDQLPRPVTALRPPAAA